MASTRAMQRAFSPLGAVRSSGWPRPNPRNAHTRGVRAIAISQALPQWHVRSDGLEACASLMEDIAVVSRELDAWVASMTVADPVEEDRPCRALFDELAEQNPLRLLAWLRDTSLDDHLLTFAAESAGSVGSDQVDEARAALLHLLQHTRAYVREGAIYGLAKLPPTVETAQAIAAMLDPEIEPSPGVRDAAEDALDTMR